MLMSRFELRQSLLMVHGLQLFPLVRTNITVHHLITVFMYISTFRLQLKKEVDDMVAVLRESTY